MRLRQIVASVAAAITIAGGVSLVAAPSASAAQIGLQADCTAATGMVVLPLEASPGDVITIAASNCGWAQIDGPSIDPLDYFTSPVPDGSWPSPVVFVVRSDAPLGETPVGFNFGVQRAGDATARLWHLTIVAAAAASTDAPIPDWVQAYGRADKDASCRDGWSPSYAMWPNNGTGGWVCTREIPSLG
jgi:hypothetical protein